MSYGEPVSYLVLERGVDVISSDGERVGALEHVLADADEDVFDGLVIDVREGPGGHRFVDAEQVGELYERAALLRLTAAEIAGLPEPQPAPAVMETHADEDPGSGLQRKLHRAWDALSGNS